MIVSCSNGHASKPGPEELLSESLVFPGYCIGDGRVEKYARADDWTEAWGGILNLLYGLGGASGRDIAAYALQQLSIRLEAEMCKPESSRIFGVPVLTPLNVPLSKVVEAVNGLKGQRRTLINSGCRFKYYRPATKKVTPVAGAKSLKVDASILMMTDPGDPLSVVQDLKEDQNTNDSVQQRPASVILQLFRKNAKGGNNGHNPPPVVCPTEIIRIILAAAAYGLLVGPEDNPFVNRDIVTKDATGAKVFVHTRYDLGRRVLVECDGGLDPGQFSVMM
jgi:hypothetical protein